jgi:hypothetical protein
MNRVLVVLLLAGCADAPPVDSIDDSAQKFLDDGKFDGVSAPDLHGAWQMFSSSFHRNDITNVELFGVPQNPQGNQFQFVRGRCANSGCAEWASEVGSYQQLRNASGTKYIRFTMGQGGGGDLYAYSLSRGRLLLRKANTTRWFVLGQIGDQAMCNQSGGAFANGNCDCSAINDGAPLHFPAFIRGLGGCVIPAGVDESTCDATGGGWTDDDAAPDGSFCLCPYGQWLVDQAGCQAL